MVADHHGSGARNRMQLLQRQRTTETGNEATLLQTKTEINFPFWFVKVFGGVYPPVFWGVSGLKPLSPKFKFVIYILFLKITLLQFP